MMRSDLKGAAAQYADMEARLGSLPVDYAALLAVSHSLRSEVAYEMNDLSQSHALPSDAMVSVEEDDAWLDVRATVTIARWMVRARHATEALAFIEPAEDFAIRGGQLLSLVKLRVIRTAAHWRLNQKSDATARLLSALRPSGKQPFRRFILDEGQEVLSIIQAAIRTASLWPPRGLSARVVNTG